MSRSIINCAVISGRGERETNAVFAFVHVKRGGMVGLDAVIKRTSTSLYCIREPRVNLFIVVFVMGTMSLEYVCYV